MGAIAWRGERILGAAWNHHCPTEYAPYTDGDPRDGFSRGVRADLSTAIHAEASVVARAARDGVPLDGADLYVTTFPCPACARLIAESGFRRCYFSGAYSVLDGDAVLRAAGVELLWVDAGGEPGRYAWRGRELNRIRTGTSGSSVRVADEHVRVHVGDGGAGEAAVAVAHAEPVVAEAELLADLPQRRPEVGERRVVQVEHVVHVLPRHDEQVQPGPGVRERVGRHRPVRASPGSPHAGRARAATAGQNRQIPAASSRRISASCSSVR